MPRERHELFRDSGTKSKEKIIVLAFEGNDTERLYFEALKDDVKFENDVIHLHLLKRPKDDTNSAPRHVYAKLKKESRDEYNFDRTDELWMIIDRDRWPNIPQIIEECNKESNFFVAVSSPCFEFWLLLHRFEVSHFTEEEQVYLIRNNRISANRTYIENLLSTKVEGGYSKTNPRPERFLPNIREAIERAEALDSPDQLYPTQLGSHVFKVAKVILNIRD